MINITVDVIGIIGFVLSAINFIYFLIIRRKKLSLNFYIHSIADYFDKKQRLKIFFCIENHSQLPISITRIRLFLNEKYYDCESSPMIVEEWSRKRNGKVLHLNGYTVETLEKKNLIESIDVYLHDDSSMKTNKYSLTNDGVIAFEHYREERLNKRNISIRSWIAIVISLIALIVTILK